MAYIKLDLDDVMRIMEFIGLDEVGARPVCGLMPKAVDAGRDEGYRQGYEAAVLAQAKEEETGIEKRNNETGAIEEGNWVWHAIEEKPRERQVVLIVSTVGNFTQPAFGFWDKTSGWAFYHSKVERPTHWAYVRMP